MDKSVTGRIHSIETFGAVDGPGVRFVVFLQGCALRCLYCHNPDSWTACGGTPISAAELIEQIKDYKNYIKNGGVTLSGGEPLMQPEFALAVILGCKLLGLHTAIDTAGSLPIAQTSKVIDAADLILLDIKSTDAFLSRALTGAPELLKNSIATLNYCEQIEKPVWIRHVLLPYYTLNAKHLESLAQMLKRYKCVKKVELLPFHKLGEYKWEQLNLQYKLKDVPPPTAAQLRLAHSIFKKHGLI